MYLFKARSLAIAVVVVVVVVVVINYYAMSKLAHLSAKIKSEVGDEMAEVGLCYMEC